MALDPTNPTSSWGLGPLGVPLGSPSTSTAPLAPKPIYSPEQIAQMRQHALALQTPPEGGIHHWTQGLAELVRAIQGNREADFARQQEMAGRQQGAEAISSLYAPYLSQGGPSPPAQGAASVGLRGSGSTDAAPNPVPSNDGTTVTADASDPRGMVPFIRETANKYGVDPDTAVKVAGSEGLRTFLGDGGKSGGAFQLYTGGGMGNDFQKETGLDPLDPKNEKATIDYALKNVPKTGWTPFHGAAKVGVGPREGILTPPSDTQAQATAPTRLAYAGDTIPPGMLPNVITQGSSLPTKPAAPNLSPMVNAIAGRPMPSPGAPVSPADFAKAASDMEASKGPPVPLPSTPINQPPPGIPPADFAKAAAAMEAGKGGPSVPLPSSPINGPGISPADFAKAAADIEATRSAPPVPLQSVPPELASSFPSASPATPPASDASAPIAGPVPIPQPRPNAANLGNFRMVPAPGGGLMPMAVPNPANGSSSVVPPSTLANFMGVPAPGTGIMPMAVPPRAQGVPSLAGPPSYAPAPTASPASATTPMAPIQVAQNGPPTSAVPSPAGGPSALPQPLTSPIGQIDPQQLTQMLANPWVPESAKAAMLQMIQQRGQPQSMPVEGGTMMFNAAGQKVFIPEPKFGTVKIGGAEIPTVSHFDPATGRWNTTTLAPGGGVQTNPSPSGPLPHPAMPQGQPNEPDLSTIGGIQAAEAAQAGAKKAAEAGGEATAKYYDSLHKGLTGSAMIAAQQKQNIDLLRQVAASPDFTPGPLGDTALAYQRLASSLGINPEGAAPRELFNQIATRILADQISGIKSMASETGETGGRIFKSMLDLEEKANITPEDSGPGINAKLDLIDNAGNLMMKWGDLADNYVKEHGKLDAGFDKELRKEISAARIPNAVPGSKETAPKMPTAPTVKQNGHTYQRQPDGSYKAID